MDIKPHFLHYQNPTLLLLHHHHYHRWWLTMAQRRWLNTLTRQVTSLLSSTSLKSPLPLPIKTLLSLTSKSCPSISSHAGSTWPHHHLHTRHFSSNYRDEDIEKEEEDEDDDDDDDGEDGDDEDEEMEGEEYINGEEVTDLNREYSTEEKEAEAAAIGYQVVGPLQRSERVFKPYEPVYAVVQIGSHQFKVSNGDSIFTERLKFCDVNDKLILSKVLVLGSATQTILGRPIVADAAVHAVVEEHALDAKVIIFKKKRRKNYRRTKGHRQELTKLRITDIQGIEKPETIVEAKPKNTAVKTQEKVAVPA